MGAQRTDARVVGRVSDRDGVLLSGAKVEVFPDREGDKRRLASGTTDEQGRFALDSLPVGEVLRLVVSAHAHVTVDERLFDLVPGETRHVGALSLRDVGVFRGRVLDGTGRPIAGATIEGSDLLPRTSDDDEVRVAAKLERRVR